MIRKQSVMQLYLGILLLVCAVLSGCGQTAQPWERLPGRSVQQTGKIGGDGGGGGGGM
jgi:hypothetical protein